MNPLHKGAYSFERVENARQAAYARDFLLRPVLPAPQGIPTQLQKDLEVVKLRLLECRNPRELDVWLHSLLRVAKLLNPVLPAAEAGAVWSRIAAAGCVRALHDFQQRWIGLFQAVGARDARAMADLAASLIDATPDLHADAREYLLMSAMAGAIASGQRGRARKLWEQQAARLSGDAAEPGFRLLRCHAQPGASCIEAFRPYAED
jgi:hypothetical protein